jgi:hypothetical protein
MSSIRAISIIALAAALIFMFTLGALPRNFAKFQCAEGRRDGRET